jgi:spermidine/putrescine transport system permease protein
MADSLTRPGAGGLTPPAPQSAEAASRGASWRQRLALLGPAFGWWAVFLVAPLALVLSYSFMRRGTYGGVIFDLTLDNFVRALDPLFVNVLLTSLRIALTTTVLALVIGYPVAYFIATRPRRWRTPLLILVILPFWTSFLIRTYAWIVLLNREGLINRPLLDLGLIGEPLPLLNSEFAITLGLLYAYLPLMILPIYASLERINPELREASTDLGASPLRTFRNVTLPLSMTGVAAGAIFVFVPSLGNFIVPQLLGGGRSVMIGNLIERQFLAARDWPFGAALASGLILITILLLLMQAWLIRRQRRVEAGDA